MSAGKRNDSLPPTASEPAYWQSEMDRAYDFMLDCLELPVRESGEPLVSLRAATEAGRLDVTYSQRPHVGGRERIFVLRQGLIEPFLEAAAELNRNGWRLHVEDGYRTRDMQQGLARDRAILRSILTTVLLETGGARPDRDLLFRRVSALVSTRPHVATHMSGSAVDISVLDRSTGLEVDRGGPYLEMSARTPMSSPFVTTGQAQARETITTIMARHGFVAYPFEFWHYNAGDVFAAHLADGRQVARYGAVSYDPRSGSCEPLADAKQALVTPDELQDELDDLLNEADGPV